MSDEELLISYRTGNQDAMCRLMKRLNKTVKAICYKFSHYASKFGLEVEDLEQECWIAFLKALDTYEIRPYGEECASFRTYVFEMCRMTILSCVRQSKPMGYKTTDDQVGIKSLYEPVFGDEDETTFEDLCESSGTDPFERIVEAEFQEYERMILNEAIGKLPPKEGEVIQLKYMEGFTQKQIAEIRNCTESCIGDYETKALSKMKRMSQVIELHDEVFGYSAKVAYRLSKKFALDNHTSSTEYLAIKRITLEEKMNQEQKELCEIMKS